MSASVLLMGGRARGPGVFGPCSGFRVGWCSAGRVRVLFRGVFTGAGGIGGWGLGSDSIKFSAKNLFVKNLSLKSFNNL